MSNEKYPLDKIPTDFNNFYFRPEYEEDGICIIEFADTQNVEAQKHAMTNPRVYVYASTMYNLIDFIFEFSPGIYAGTSLLQENEKHLIRAIKDPTASLFTYQLVDRYTGHVYIRRAISISSDILRYALQKTKDIPVPPFFEALVMARSMAAALPRQQMVEDAVVQMKEAGLI
jgi:hypothetical protein